MSIFQQIFIHHYIIILYYLLYEGSMSYQSWFLIILLVVFCASDAYYILPVTQRVAVSRARFIAAPLLSSNVPDATTATSTAEPVNLTLKQRLQIDMKNAMRNKEKVKLAAIRAIQAAVNQKEIDDRVDVSDEMVVGIMSKLVKQRKESILSYQAANRPDLVAAEQEECDRIIEYMPKQLTEEEINTLIAEVMVQVGATTVKDMGKVMAVLRPALTGKADISVVGDLIKKRLGGK